MVALCSVALLALVPVAGALDDRARARTAADAAALAGAADGEQAARQVASANGADLLEMERDGDDVVVQVRVGEVEAYAKARATHRAGPGGADALSGAAPPLTTVRSITVHSGIAGKVEALVAAAAADGVTLSGTGYRSSRQQIELRRAHCGTTRYAIYEAPPSSCSPPTARPGTSMHERGLAIDFDRCASRSSACWRWLSAHAGDFGFYNLPSEPWHWSTNGM